MCPPSRPARYTLGNVCNICSTLFLVGPESQWRRSSIPPAMRCYQSAAIRELPIRVLQCDVIYQRGAYQSAAIGELLSECCLPPKSRDAANRGRRLHRRVTLGLRRDKSMTLRLARACGYASWQTSVIPNISSVPCFSKPVVVRGCGRRRGGPRRRSSESKPRRAYTSMMQRSQFEARAASGWQLLRGMV